MQKAPPRTDPPTLGELWNKPSPSHPSPDTWATVAFDVITLRLQLHTLAPPTSGENGFWESKVKWLSEKFQVPLVIGEPDWLDNVYLYTHIFCAI
jgi:hypothetical protein